MYFSTPVKVPAVSGKIVRKKQGACTYVLFETERVYDPKRRFNVPKRVIIGKLLSDGEDDLMLPNERFLKHFPDAQLSPVTRLQSAAARCARGLISPSQPSSRSTGSTSCLKRLSATRPASFLISRPT